MLEEQFLTRISDDWIWREGELRKMNASIVRSKSDFEIKSAILISYAHWEGHFKTCADSVIEYMAEGIRRKIFKWTDIKSDVRQRLLFCGYRRSSLSGQTHETFISYLNAINDDRHLKSLSAKDEIIMIDDNLNTMRAEAICRNVGIDYSWCTLKKVVIDERILEHRNAIAHGSRRLRTGDEIDSNSPDLRSAVQDAILLMREAKNRFENCIVQKEFLISN